MVRMSALSHSSEGPRPPAAVGMHLDEVDTPALLLDLATFERNLARLPLSLGGAPSECGPMGSLTKCPEIALRPDFATAQWGFAAKR